MQTEEIVLSANYNSAPAYLMENQMQDNRQTNILKPLHNNKSNTTSLDSRLNHVSRDSCSREINTHDIKIPLKVLYENEGNYCLQVLVKKMPNEDIERENENMIAHFKNKLL